MTWTAVAVLLHGVEWMWKETNAPVSLLLLQKQRSDPSRT